MRKLLTILAITLFGCFGIKNPVGAISQLPTPTPTPAFSALSVRLEQPKTPTNLREFDIVYVALDLTGRDITVTCWKDGPNDADYVQFGAPLTITGGGNTGVCPVTSNIIDPKGDYLFKVVATAGTDEKIDTATVTYNNEGPGDPTGYSKERTNLCDYKIKFRSADDNNKTVKIEVYRSENTSFTADSGSRVDTITIGSNTEGQSITTPPTCDKEYYFGVRAFDNAGNGSNVVGDSIVKFTTTTPSTTGTTGGGAIALTSPSEGSVLGKETKEGEGAILGETTPSATESKPSQLAGFFQKNGILILGILLLIIGTIGLYVSKKKTNQ